MSGKSRKPRSGNTFGKNWGTAFDSPKFGGSGTPSTPRRESGGRGRREEAPYVEVGGGNDCEDCEGTGTCSKCENGQYKLRDGSYRACRACRWNPSKCYPCRGTGKERPTRYRRD
jgi:hypothetical protein